jgi:hypothetical protein
MLINAKEFSAVFLDLQSKVREDVRHAGTLNEPIILGRNNYFYYYAESNRRNV